MTSRQADFENKVPEGALERAGFYLMILDERSMTASEKAEFSAWLQESDLHRHALKKVALVWGRMDVLKGLADIFPFELMHTEPSSKSASFASVLKPAMAACFAAAIVFGAAFGGYMYSSNSGPHSGAAEANFSSQIITGIGEVETLGISDGSTITANTDSILSVSVSAQERKVTLEKGEAYFEVAHDPDRTFDVVVDDTIVRAVGTAFSVQKNGDDIQVIVTEGVVEILKASSIDSNESGVADEALKKRVSATDKRATLRPGDVAELSEDKVEVSVLAKQDLGRQHTWREGMLVFDGEPLEEVIAEFSRYNKIQMDILDDDIRSIRVGGYFNSGDVAGMLSALEGNFGVKVTYLEANRIQLASAE